MSDPWLGRYGWERGPLVVAPARVREALLADGKPAAALAKKSAHVAAGTVGDDPVWVLGGGAQPTRVWTFGRDCVVFVRVEKYANPRTVLPTVIEFQPGWAPSDGWAPVRGKLPIGGGEVLLFDAVGRYPEDPGPRPEDPVFQFEVAGGVWRARWQQVVHRKIGLILVLLVREGCEANLTAPTERPADPEPLVVTDDVAAAASKLEFVSSEGGPVLVLPLAHQAHWHGFYAEDGSFAYEEQPTDYDRACVVGGAIIPIPCGPSEAWVLPGPDGVAFHPLPDGGLLVRWVGADNPETLLAGALQAPAALWKDTGHVLVSEGGFLVLDAGEDGRRVEGPTAAFMLPAGRYAVWSMDEFDGEVRWGDTVHDLMLTAVRLRRLP